MGLRWGASFLALWVFLLATFLVMRPANPMVSGAFVPLIVATVYAIFGIWKGLRFLFAGIAVAALTLIGVLFANRLGPAYEKTYEPDEELEFAEAVASQS